MQVHVQPPPQQQQQPQSQLESQESLVHSQLADESDQVSHSSRKQKIKQVSQSLQSILIMSTFFFVRCSLQYVKREIAKFFGVDVASEDRERVKWSERQKRLALRRFGSLKQVTKNTVFS